MNHNTNFQWAKFKSMPGQILIILLIDIVVLAAFVWWIDATPDVAIGELLIVPFIVVVNLILAAGFRYIFKNKTRASLLLMNALLAAFIFHWLFYLWFIYYDKVNFKFYYFTFKNNHYQVFIDRRNTSYSILKLSPSDDGPTTELKTGKYQIHKDSLILIDSTKRMLIYNNKLTGSLYGNSIDLSNTVK